MSAFDVQSLAETAELQLAMVLVFGRLVRSDHSLGQIRIFTAAVDTPGAEVGAFRGHPDNWSGTGRVKRFSKQRDRILASQAVHDPVAERGIIFGHYKYSYDKC
jgi:hypothetical protein